MQRTITVSLDARQFHALVAAVATEATRLNRLPVKLGSDCEQEMHLLDGYNAVRSAWYAQESRFPDAYDCARERADQGYPTPHHETAGDWEDWAADLAIDHTIEERA